MQVVMLDVLGKDCLEVTAAEDEHLVEALATYGAITRSQIAFARGAPTGVLMILVPPASKEAVNLASRSRMRNLTAVPWSASSMERLRAHWVTHAATRLAVIPAIRTRRVVMDEHEDVEPAEEHRVGVEEVTRHQPFRLGGEELRPGRFRPPWRWVDAVVFQYRPDARWGDDNADGGELPREAK
ncbi:MAG: hypothetical protein ACYCTL_10680 [Acidimicrobiales bacterium]